MPDPIERNLDNLDRICRAGVADLVKDVVQILATNEYTMDRVFWPSSSEGHYNYTLRHWSGCTVLRELDIPYAFVESEVFQELWEKWHGIPWQKPLGNHTVAWKLRSAL